MEQAIRTNNLGLKVLVDFEKEICQILMRMEPWLAKNLLESVLSMDTPHPNAKSLAAAGKEIP